MIYIMIIFLKKQSGNNGNKKIRKIPNKKTNKTDMLSSLKKQTKKELIKH